MTSRRAFLALALSLPTLAACRRRRRVAAGAPVHPRDLDKRREMAERIGRGEAVRLYLDPRKAGVDVPEAVRDQPMLVLEYATSRVRDLDIDEDGVGATLAVAGAERRTFVPWGAVFAVGDRSGSARRWPADVPLDVGGLRPR